MLLAVSLDDLREHFTPPTVLKINVGIAELEVLSVATRLLSQTCLATYCEFSAQRKLDVTALVQRYGYRL